MGGYGGWRPDPAPRHEPEVIPKNNPLEDMPLPGHAPPTDQLALHTYNNLRFTCHELEELIGEGWDDLTEKDRKRLDKAVTVMKVGFKIMKKVLKSRARRRESWGGSTPRPKIEA